MTDGKDEAGKLADSARGLWLHRTPISTQLHLQRDMWSETGRRTKTVTDTAADREEDRLRLEGPIC